MDCLEKGIHQIDEHTKNAIQKHKDILANTIFKTAQKSNNSATLFDKNMKKIFSDLDNMGQENNVPFNPLTVVEFRDGKAFQVIDHWDKEVGILPSRKIMGSYYLDIAKEQINQINDSNYFCHQHQKNSGSTKPNT